MKILLRIILILLPGLVLAQDSVINITPAMFDKATDQKYLSNTDGWLFRLGNDTAWAGKNIDITGWRKIKPTALSAKYADNNERLEGWFRVKIKLSDKLEGRSFGIKYSAIGAADIYIDGKLLSSYGNTGLYGGAYRDYHTLDNPDFPAGLKPGKEYTIAVHFVDHIAAFPPGQLKSQVDGLNPFLRITGPSYNKIFISDVSQQNVYATIWVAIAAILTLLFWFLSIRNPYEKNLRLIAIGNTFLLLGMLCADIHSYKPNLSFGVRGLYIEVGNLFIALTFVMAPIILAAIFKRKMVLSIKILMVVGTLLLILSDMLPQAAASLYSLCFYGSIFVICIYYIISSWKNLRGAQWAIVIGLLLSVAFGVLYILLNNVIGITSTNVFNLLVSGFALSFPILLMIYVAMRFGEILREVQQNADEVVRLSEEKRQEALKRQQVLEHEVKRQTAEIRTTLDDLKATQTQLVQSEKMASLGELTAGIAHEIQNPLNFVNNFSEVNAEMIDELKEELKNGNIAEALTIANDIGDNEKKIRHHGKRADSIVKGMLEHSRVGSGEKQLVNINALADEFLKLSYHGLRAKDKSFNAELLTRFDEHLPKVNIAQQDIGRVLLNLFNNAFYAVNQKQKIKDADYKPEVSVSTTIEKNNLVIKVKDNGNGIPDAIRDKIMQPFFTTKPTGEGTGLGLSLSYDIVVKGHGGSINMDSTEGDGAEFSIYLPII